LTQSFENPTDETLEAVYVFPLPEGAAVDGLELTVGDHRYRGEIREKEEARKTYEQAKVEGKGAGLVEQHRPNIFRTSVANIPPHATVVVRIETLDEASWSGGSFSTVFPTTITARYDPHGGAASDAAAPSTALPSITLAATVDAGVPLDEVTSPSHALERTERGRATTVRTEAVARSDRDFVLRWRPRRGSTALGGGLVETRPDGTYGLAMIVPPTIDGGHGMGWPTQSVFVIDVSGSMAGTSLAQAQAALAIALDRLRPGDTFTLIKFDSENEAYSERFLPADPREIAAAKRWIAGLTVGGGTEIVPALVRALALSESGDARAAKRVVLITDGAVDNEGEAVVEVERRLGGTRLHIIGIGLAPNRWLMKELARAGRGTFESIGSNAEIAARTAALMKRTERAVVTDVALEWDGAPPLDADPDPVPDLYAGQPLTVTARFDPSKPVPRLRVWGRAPGGPVTMNVDFQPAPAGAGIGTRWARARIASLERSQLHGADPANVKADVVDLAKRFSLVSSFTSFVVVADEAYEESTPDDTLLPQGGTDEPLLLAIGLLSTVLGLLLAAPALRAALTRP
jgi:Ca-activated chloride channel family protein